MTKNISSFYHTTTKGTFSGFVAGKTHIHFCDVLSRNIQQAYEKIEYMSGVEFYNGDVAVSDDGVIYIYHSCQWWDEYWYHQKFG
jgi:hypothetical protein